MNDVMDEGWTNQLELHRWHYTAELATGVMCRCLPVFKAVPCHDHSGSRDDCEMCLLLIVHRDFHAPEIDA